MHNYIQWKKSNVEPVTVKYYTRWVSLFISFCDKENGFTLEDTSRFKLFLEEARYSPKNIQYGLSIIRDFLNYKIAVEGLDFPLALFRVKTERSKSHYAVTEEEYKAMISVLPHSEPMSLQRRVMIMMLHDTGMRGGELLRLRISDLKERHAYIDNEKNKRRRLISWSKETDKYLQKYLGLRENLLTTEDWVFVSLARTRDRKMTTRQLERIMLDSREAAGLTAIIRPHSFRHGFVHRQLSDGKPITTVAQMLGHSSTMNVINYAQLSSKEIRDAWGLVS